MTTDSAIQTTQPHSVDVTKAPNRQGNWTYRPSVDIFDTPDKLILITDMPGASPETIEVGLEGGILTLQAQVHSRQFAQARSLEHEYGVGNFHRRFEIDQAIDANEVSAEYRDGALTVQLPKAQQARRRRIPVSA